MTQTSLADFIAPTVTILSGAADRPRAYRVDKADGTRITVKRLADPGYVWVDMLGGPAYRSRECDLPAWMRLAPTHSSDD